MIRKLLQQASIALLISTASLANAQQDGIYYAAHHDYRVVPVAEGLVQPWSMAWLPDGDVLVTEKPGRLRIIRDGNLLPEAVPGVPEVLWELQGGLFEVVPHPDFENNRWIYLSYAKPQGGGSTTAIARARLENDRLTNVVDIFVAQAIEGRAGHYGGKIAFDDNGYLFLTHGDRIVMPNGDEEALRAHPAQDLSNHNGVIIRLNDDGTVPNDNPFVGDSNALPEIWSYGHRSPQGLAFHPMTGDLWMSEHGPQGGDEVNLVEPGENYGWPVFGFGVNYVTGTPIHAAISSTDSVRPAHVWVPSIATSGLIAYSGDKFPMWRGSLFAGALAGEKLARLQLSADYKEVVLEETLAYNMGRIRDVRQGPDGYIYLAVSDRSDQPISSIVRLEPVE